MAPSLKLLAVALAAVFSTANGQSCTTNVVNNTTPAPGTGIQLQQYSYCGGTLNLTVFIENLCYNKIVKAYWSNANDQATALTAAGLGYASDVPNSKYEYWFASTQDVYLDGITRLLNVTYAAVDINENYFQELDIKVTPSGPTPVTSSIPAPYASPTGFASDIDSYLSSSSSSQAANAKKLMFANIEIPGAANGTVIAAQSYTAPDYAYNWVRDTSLTMKVVELFYANAKAPLKQKYEQLFFRYAKARAQQQNDPGLQTGLGEPKFFLNNSIFTGPWGRPQNDGAATASIYLMTFAKDYVLSGGSYKTVKSQLYDSDSNPMAPLKKDLLFVANNWTSPSFDLWEEEQGDHFYTRMVQHRALEYGAIFARLMNDSATATTLATAAKACSDSLAQFWDPIRSLVLYEYGPVLNGKYSYKDIAVVLALIHGYSGDGLYPYTDDKMLSSAVIVSTSFLSIYPITSTHFDNAGLPLGPATGRYPEDVYNGVDTSQGNPWYLACSSMAEFMYRAAQGFNQARSITVSNVSAPFWNYYAPRNKYTVGTKYSSNSAQFKGMIAALQGWGDAYIRTIKYYSPTGHLSEEFNRNTGVPTGAADLTWSYGSLLTAAIARAELKGDRTFLSTLSNIA